MDLAGGQGDADMTGMALQALSFYYGKRTDVNAAVERGLARISENQLKAAGLARRELRLPRVWHRFWWHFPDSALTEARMHVF